MKATSAGCRTGGEAANRPSLACGPRLDPIGEGDQECSGASKPPELRRSVPAAELFGGRREVFIEHSGEIYTLRLTRKGKLILNK